MILRRRDFLYGVAASALGGCLTAERASLPSWRHGELDIHFIHTGVGEQTFFIFPDGTTMLLDCGDTHHAKYMCDVPPQPSAEKCGGEWVSRYIQRLVPQREIDYLMVSHWHGDHIGDPSLGCWKNAAGKQICGITAVAEDFRFRYYFDHQFPCPGQYAMDPDPEAYELFQKWLAEARAAGMDAQPFRVGAFDQIRLMRDAARDPQFHVRNLCANAVLWDGKDGTVDCGAAHVKSGRRTIHENRLSAAIRIDYGAFSYYSGGDQPAELARLTGMHATFAKAIFYRGGQYGVMLLSREKPVDVVQVPLPGEEPRVLLLCEFTDCVVGTTHLSVAAESERTASIELIRKAVSSFVGKKPVFLTGDWNSLSDSAVLRGLGGFLKVFSDTNCQTYHGRQENGPDGQPFDMSKFCIDYIACDNAHAGAFKVLDAHVVEDRKTSDHAPIVVTLETPDAAQPRPALVPVPVNLTMCEGIRRVKAGKVAEEIITKRMTDATLPKEGYRLDIDTDVIAVVSSDDAGFFYALQTLKQLAFFSYGRLAFPCCTIEDAPRFGWRGVHWDDSRHFFGKSAVKRTLDLMAQHKLNVFHWHLTDDQGWRLPVKRYPKLTTIGAARPYSTNQKDLADRFSDGVYGPFSYVREDIAEVVAYARERHIRVVPEVDVPGHCAALLKAYPEYGCFADCPEKAPQGAVDNVICLGNDKSLEMVFAIFDELVAMFPDELVHIGGDEVNKVNYRTCSKCQARMKTLGLKTENDLQAWFARELGKHLAKRGKRVLGWDELILDGEPPANMVAMSWRGAEGGRAAAKAGLEAVMCPHFYCYFDYSQCLPDDPAVYPWFTERLPLEKAYAYDPLEGIPNEQQKYILGGQCCNWAEFSCNETELQWKMWPRACATAEVFWRGNRKPPYDDFLRRMKVHRKRLMQQGVNCASLE